MKESIPALYQWQSEVVEKAKTQPNFAMLCDMGCGKTRTAIEILRLRYNTNKRIMRTLIVSPAVTLFNWREEILMYSKIGKDEILVSEGSGAKRVKQLADSESRIIILNYEALINSGIYTWLRLWEPEIIIADESHNIKNGKSKRTKALLNIAKTAKHRIIMSGTPILTSVEDIFMQYLFLDQGETFGVASWTFKMKYMFDANEGWKNKAAATGIRYFPKWLPRPETFPELNAKILSKGVRVTKEECLKDLPPLVRLTKYCDLGAEQLKHYIEMKRDFITFIDTIKDKPQAVIAQMALTKSLRLQQIVSGFVKTDDGNTIRIKGKIPRLILLEELVASIYDRHKFIIWTCFNEDNTIISEMLERMEIQHTFLTGAINARQKQENMHAFRTREEVRGIVANRHAGGIGVNLIEASFSFVYSRNFSYGDEKQSEARNHRGGSQIHEKITKIDIVARGTLDEFSIVKGLNDKHTLSKEIIDRIRNN